jgi:6-phosphogluconolactonase
LCEGRGSLDQPFGAEVQAQEAADQVERSEHGMGVSVMRAGFGIKSCEEYMMDELRGVVGVEHRTFTGVDALVREVAGQWVDWVASGGGGSVALSGGRVAAQFFRATVEAVRARGVVWAGWDCFWADERCVPPGDEQSNYFEAERSLLRPLGWEAARVHRVRGEVEPDLAASESELALKSVVGEGGVLDLVILGMGEDGHVASLFPGQAFGVEEGGLYRAVVGPKPPPRRVTLTLPVLLRARQVWVMVTGEGKREVLDRALRGDEGLPLGRVLRGRTVTQVFSCVGVA